VRIGCRGAIGHDLDLGTAALEVVEDELLAGIAAFSDAASERHWRLEQTLTGSDRVLELAHVSRDRVRRPKR